MALLEAYKKQSENPISVDGSPLRGAERSNAIEQSKRNYENMKAHILNSLKIKGPDSKFCGHPITAELLPKAQPKPEPEPEPKPEVKPKGKKDGKKSKR